MKWPLMLRSTHERVVTEAERSARSAVASVVFYHVSEVQAHHREVAALRGEVVNARNQLAIEKGRQVADAHANGRPAPGEAP